MRGVHLHRSMVLHNRVGPLVRQEVQRTLWRMRPLYSGLRGQGMRLRRLRRCLRCLSRRGCVCGQPVLPARLPGQRMWLGWLWGQLRTKDRISVGPVRSRGPLPGWGVHQRLWRRVCRNTVRHRPLRGGLWLLYGQSTYMSGWSVSVWMRRDSRVRVLSWQYRLSMFSEHHGPKAILLVFTSLWLASAGLSGVPRGSGLSVLRIRVVWRLRMWKPSARGSFGIASPRMPVPLPERAGL